MADVKNWQISRTMPYPHEEEAMRPKRQFALVMDLNKCIACQTCTIACKQTWTWAQGQEYMLWNNVESKPYGFFPLGWDVRILEKLGASQWDGTEYAGKTIFEAAPSEERVLGWFPESLDWSTPNVGEDEPKGVAQQGTYVPSLPHNDMWMYYLPRICNHCTYPGCVAACPRQAIYKREEDGIVLVDQTRCRGYQECVQACPYKKTMFNSITHVSEKCIGCYPAIEQGKQTQCTVACIGRIRLTGFVNTPDNIDETNPIDYLVHVKKVALPLYPQLGLEPNIYYIPPKHVPAEYLHQMFGPGVDQAIENYSKLKEDTEMRGLLVLMGATDKIIFSFKVEEEMAYGYDAEGTEIVSVPLVEPVFVLNFYDETHDVYRHNIT